MPFIETTDDFCRRHGAPLERDRVHLGRDLFLFPDGATLQHNPIGADILHEPPADAKTRLEARRKYHAVKLARIRQHFAALKTALTHPTVLPFQWPEAEYGAGPPDGKAALLLLKAHADALALIIAGIDAEIEALPERQARRKHEAMRREFDHQARMRAHESRAEIEAIDL